MTHYPAAHINAIAEEGTKAEAVECLQKHWNSLQDAKAEIERLQVMNDKLRDIAGAERITVIEECARVAEDWGCHKNAVAAIRALKDKV